MALVQPAQILSNAREEVWLPAGDALCFMRQQAGSGVANAAIVSQDGPTGFTSQQFTVDTVSVVGPFAYNCVVCLDVQGGYKVSQANAGLTVHA